MPPSIIVYSTPLCAPCEALKRALKARGVSFRTVDLLMDEAAAERWKTRASGALRHWRSTAASIPVRHWLMTGSTRCCGHRGRRAQ
ncbi:glutaredoxin family protein [Reyranella sp.]|uniref:glutaredoxin family protein n=1 Tax=Reyranella sp. TaxID=1929291 RepID=UPI002731D657|nr:glutaredoxin family protein [Reyranella sp.]MDP2374682.1 glutaredoxin family protein [Reyranella sp.]